MTDPSTGSQALDKEVLEKVKAEIEEELKHLDEEILEAFTSTGFDCHTSPVFSPADPETSIEDCLAHLGEKVSQELREPLRKALDSLLSKPVTYQEYRERTQEAAVHATGWSKFIYIVGSQRAGCVLCGGAMFCGPQLPPLRMGEGAASIS
uniref:Uncharacterized protein n=1 Tax=Sphaerodactylus townsendi TaxID=933632 RepID=A0ACB8FN69_9SAUR